MFMCNVEKMVFPLEIFRVFHARNHRVMISRQSRFIIKSLFLSQQFETLSNIVKSRNHESCYLFLEPAVFVAVLYHDGGETYDHCGQRRNDDTVDYGNGDCYRGS